MNRFWTWAWLALTGMLQEQWELNKWHRLFQLRIRDYDLSGNADSVEQKYQL